MKIKEFLNWWFLWGEFKIRKILVFTIPIELSMATLWFCFCCWLICWWSWWCILLFKSLLHWVNSGWPVNQISFAILHHKDRYCRICFEVCVVSFDSCGEVAVRLGVSNIDFCVLESNRWVAWFFENLCSKSISEVVIFYFMVFVLYFLKLFLKIFN